MKLISDLKTLVLQYNVFHLPSKNFIMYFLPCSVEKWFDSPPYSHSFPNSCASPLSIFPFNGREGNSILISAVCLWAFL